MPVLKFDPRVDRPSFSGPVEILPGGYRNVPQRETGSHQYADRNVCEWSRASQYRREATTYEEGAELPCICRDDCDYGRNE